MERAFGIREGSFTYCKMDSAMIGTTVMVGVAGSAFRARVLVTLEGPPSIFGGIVHHQGRGQQKTLNYRSPEIAQRVSKLCLDRRSLDIYPRLSAPLPSF